MKVTADDIAQLLASTPPRRVPAHVVKAAQGGGPGCFVAVFGLLFGGVGLIFAALFFPWRLMDDWRLAAGDRTAPGEIRRVSGTSLSINDTKVIEYAFTYTPAGDRPREAVCFTTGRKWGEGSAVTVRYLPGNPEVACVEGARLTRGGGLGVIVIIFPLLGGGLAGWFLVHRARTRRLLRQGLMTEVDVVSVEETAMKVNYQTVHRIVIQGPALHNGQPVTVKRVKKSDVELALRHARDKQPVFILFDPQKHSRVLFPEALIESDG